MKLSSQSEMRRCRPLLGTLVEITASGLGEDKLQAAIHAAFEVMEKIQKLMSAHDPASELSLLNREADSRPVVVSCETFQVLRLSDRIASESRGSFDYTIAPALARWGLMPSRLRRKNPGDWRDVLLLPGRQVFFLQPLALDLGGIAKGYAVDKAVEVLREKGVSAAVVNAGGDLRVFGKKSYTIQLRHPSRPQEFARSLNLQQAALATSSPCFTERRWRGTLVSHLVNPTRGSSIVGGVSASVRASECWLADALTKVVLNDARLAEQLLNKYEAESFILAA